MCARGCGVMKLCAEQQRRSNLSIFENKNRTKRSEGDVGECVWNRSIASHIAVASRDLGHNPLCCSGQQKHANVTHESVTSHIVCGDHIFGTRAGRVRGAVVRDLQIARVVAMRLQKPIRDCKFKHCIQCSMSSTHGKNQHLVVGCAGCNFGSNLGNLA